MRTGLLAPTSAASSTYKAPTTKDIPAVTLTNIPHVDPAAFKDYLARIGPLFDTFQRARTDNQNATPKPNDRIKDSDGVGSPSPSRNASSASLLSPVDPPQQPRRRSSAYTKRRLNEPTPLSTIPNVYFDQDFHLENPRTFDVVSEHAEIVKPAPGTPADDQNHNGQPRPPRKSLANNAILQEKLSWYMDTVEVHLINSISAASTSFFAALGSLRDLEHEAADSVSRIQKLRADLAKLDQDMAIGGLEVANLRTRHQNVRKLAAAVQQVASVVEQARHCEELVETGKYDAASDGMEQLRKMIAGRSDRDSATPNSHRQYIDLRNLKALQGLSDSLAHLQSRIGKGFESRFLDTLLSDLRTHIEKVPPKDTLRRWASSFQRQRGEARIQQGPPAYMDTNEQVRKDLLASLKALAGSGQTAQATAAFREAIMKEMKALIRKHLPSSTDDDVESVTSVSTRGGRHLNQQEKSAILARNLRALDEEAAEELYVKVYTGVSECLRKLSIQIKVLLDVTSRVEAPAHARPSQDADGQLNRAKSPAQQRRTSLQEEMTQALDLSSLLGQAVDVAQTQITRILKVRMEQTIRMPQERFLRYFTLNRLFADECEAVSGSSGTALKNIVTAQLTAYVHARSEAENQRIAQKLDSDQWEAKDFTDKDKDVLSRILQGMSSDPPTWVQGVRIWEDAHSQQSNGTSTTAGDAVTNGTLATPDNAGATKPPNRPAYVDDSRYVLVASGIFLLGSIEGFLSLLASIPASSSVAVQALADLLRTFNSRTSQLVLGAGATRIAGLRNITTRHLALASQALSFVIALIPYMRETVRRHVTGTAATKAEILGEFDKVKRLYQDHQLGIHDKLVEIMTARAAAHVNTMKKMDYDAEAAKGGTAASAYMETLTKETGTLHRVLSRFLSEPDVAGIAAQIFNSYKETWTRAFAEANVKTAAGKNRQVFFFFLSFFFSPSIFSVFSFSFSFCSPSLFCISTN